jgi:hypothetical protein
MSKGGRVSKLSPQGKHFCVRGLTSGKVGEVRTAVAATKLLKDELGVDVNEHTVRRALQEAGLKAAEKEKVPLLSAKNVKARLEFALAHKDWTVEDWKRVVWSDETKICRFCSDGRFWYWARDGESRQSHHVKQTVKHGGGSLMIWSCMTAQGVGFMCKITGTMDQHLYKEILETDLQKTIDWYGLDPERVIFQHDNDPKHRTASVQEWLDQQMGDRWRKESDNQ